MPSLAPVALLQGEKELGRAAEEQLKHAQEQIEALRRELGEKGASQGAEVEALRAEVGAAHKELNGVLEDRYQLQVSCEREFK